MSKIIVTGAGGFIGSNLIRSLIKTDHDIVIFLKNDSNLWRIKDVLPQLETRIVNLGNLESLKNIIKEINPEIVYHLATYGSYPHQQNIKTAVRTNVVYSINLMRALELCNNLKKFVNAGSSSEYGPKDKPMKETDVVQPVTSYGITKVTQTLFTHYFAIFNKLPALTLRFFSVYGPYEEPSRLISDLMLALIRKQHLKLSSPNVTRDFIYVDDVINALHNAAKISSNNGEIFNIGTGIESSIKDIVNLATKITNNKLDFSWDNKGKKRSFDYEKKWVADITKSINVLNWKPKYSLNDGILQTYKWFQNNIYLY